MTVLVTGGAGYIGSHTAKGLAAAGITAIAYDNLTTGHPWAVQWGPLVTGDVSDAALLRSTIREYGVNAVLHFAANALVGESVLDPRKYYRNNLMNSIELLDAMLETGVRHIVFSSTCAIYGDPQSHCLSEDHPQLPVNPYGETKLAIERALQSYGRAYGIESVCLRYFNAAGADPDDDIGECREPETHLIPLILEAALDRTRPISIFGTDFPTPDGSAVRDYVHVSDLADAHVGALRFLANGGSRTAFNLGTGRGHSVFEVIDTVERVTGRTVPTVIAPRRAGDPPRLIADTGRARSELQWTPQRNLDDMIRSAWKFRLGPRFTAERSSRRASGNRAKSASSAAN
jgi:UDP-arabinose 4-epimerase